MSDTMNDKFDRDFRNKFRDAKFEPTTNVWEGVEASLLKAENAKIKRKAVFYRNVAAAVLLLAFISLYFNFSDQWMPQANDFGVAVDIEQGNSFNNEAFNQSLNKPIIVSNDVLGAKELKSLPVNENEGLASEISNKVKSNALSGKSSPVALAELNESYLAAEPRQGVALASLDRLQAAPPYDIAFGEVNREVKEVSYFEVKSYEQKEEKSDNAAFSNFIADVSFGSGSFNPNATRSNVNSPTNPLVFSNASDISSRSTVDQKTQEELIDELSSAPMRSNLSVTYGLNFGFQLYDRFQVKSGLQYGKYRSTSESGVVIRDPNTNELYPYHAASNIAASNNDMKIGGVTAPYNLYNDFEILSVPVLLSYKLFDWKLNVSMVAGSTVDFLLSNKITGASDQLNALAFDKDSNAGYNNVFASGIVGLELTYQIGEHYGLSLTPQYKRTFTDVTRSDASFNSRPAFASVNMSFQYLF